MEIQGNVQVFHAGATNGSPAQVNELLFPDDRIETAENSRAGLRWSGESVVPVGPSTELEILPPDGPEKQSGLELFHGVLSFFHRDKPGLIHIITRGAVAGVRGTEFVLAADDAGDTTLAVVDGKVDLGNGTDTLLLINGEQGVVEAGKAPARTTGFIANNLLQWCFYYPAVLDLNDLPLTAAEQNDLATSLAAYRSGDLPGALAQYPTNRTDGSESEKIYHAAILLSVGEVEKSETILASISHPGDRTQRLSDALRQLIAAVKRQPYNETAQSAGTTTNNYQFASEYLAASYFAQSRALGDMSLRQALDFARKATELSPQSGFAWERAAELEFSFGQTDRALKALDKSLALAPRNAQALTLKGFVLAACDEPRKAIVSFDDALTVNSSLANAWLGRGLSRIRLGDKRGGREDLLTAAALEPQRAELRSYLGKAYANTGDYQRAMKELDLAKKLDPKDPTAWLYSALLNQQDSQINTAIRDLEKSEELNDNRSVYRSQLLLDGDNAVRRANLAGIYRDDGMLDLSLREAQRAVSTDYGNYSAHLFLGNSYNQLRDPNWSNLRYESPATSEFYIANLLAPGSAGVLSDVISEPAYINLFDQNRLGVVSDTEYLSRGAWFQEGAQFGVYDNLSYNFEAKYTSDPGQRPNNYEQHRDLILTVKDQFTSKDSVFVSVEQDKINNGNVNEVYDPSQVNYNFQSSQSQNPNIFIGYHHEWAPGVHTLFFGTRRVGDETATVSNSTEYLTSFDGSVFDAITPLGEFQNIKISPEEYSGELQQIWEQAAHTTIVGVHYAWGHIHYENMDTNLGNDPNIDLFANPPNAINQNFDLDFHHFSAYGYHTWQIWDPFSLTAGLAYDWLHQPTDIDTTPFALQEKTTTQFSPKVGGIYTPFPNTIFRAAYTRSLSGLSDNQSYRIEPTEVAGFNQDFRSIIPESVIGDTSGSRFDAIDASLEQKFDTGTYLALSGEILYSKLNNLQGAFVWDTSSPALTNDIQPSGLNQSLDFRERSAMFTADQLLGKQLEAGVRYRISQADFDQDTPELPPDNGVLPPSQHFESVLQTFTFHANWNHPSGLFASFDADWYHQRDTGFSTPTMNMSGDDFWQLNAYAGCRFWHRRAEVSIGLLNITDQDYHLEPLNLYNELPHGRTLLARLLITF